MKKIVLTFAASILIAGFSFANENKESSSEDLSMAETEFISQCDELVKFCENNIENKLIYCPEIVIINEDNICLMAGPSSNIHIKRFMKEANFLTRVHDTSFYKIERHLPSMETEEVFANLR